MLFTPYKPSIDKLPFIIELKWNKDTDCAINQIENKEYYKAIKNYSGKILLVGITYNSKDKKHTCKIKEIKI